MRALRILTAVILLSFVAGTARADGLLYQLPKDGTWVAFDYQENAESMGMKINRKGTLYMSSVGRTTEGEDECRWMEFSFEGTRNGTKYTNISKVLIPEKYLKKGENPLEHMVRGWLTRRGNVRELEKPIFGPRYLPAWLPGPLEEVEKLEKQVVESKLGKLECEGLTGSTVQQFPREFESQRTFHIRLHKKAPFGVVFFRMDSEATRSAQPQRTTTITLKLSDFGEDADSELPDHN